MKTADIKKQSCRVEEHMTMSAVDKGSFCTIGQGKLAPAAADGTDGFVSLLGVLLLGGERGPVATGERVARPLAQAIGLMWRLRGECESHSSGQWRPPDQRWCAVVAGYGW